MGLYEAFMLKYPPLDPNNMGGYYQQSVVDPGDYTGQFDDKGQRYGIGNCKWSNGSHYEGDLMNNSRASACLCVFLLRE